MNYYSHVTLDEGIPSTEAEFDQLVAILVRDEDEDPHGLSADYEAGKIYIFGEENGQMSAIPDDALELLGRLINKAGLTRVGWGEAWTADRPCPNSHGGTTGYIYPDGTLFVANRDDEIHVRASVEGLREVLGKANAFINHASGKMMALAMSTDHPSADKVQLELAEAGIELGREILLALKNYTVDDIE